ncbi:MAG TPA: hypothetical protein VF152_06565 [Acidimicrobiia bacterium]
MAARGRFVTLIAVGATALVATGCLGPTTAPPPRPVVILYGDSLAWESRSSFDWHLGPGVQVVHRNFPGVAPCDVLPSMAADAAFRPSAVVFEFAGNSLTPCMNGVTPATLVLRYTLDVARARSIFTDRGIPVFLMGAPLLPGWSFDPTPDLHAAFTALADQHPRTSFTDAGRSVLGAQGAYTTRLPCLPGEGIAAGCVAGRITVRSPDRVHFCPAGRDPCPVWSSGAWRFGAAMAAPVRRALGL